MDHNTGYLVIDLGGADFGDTATQKIKGIYAKFQKANKIILLTNFLFEGIRTPVLISPKLTGTTFTGYMVLTDASFVKISIASNDNVTLSMSDILAPESLVDKIKGSETIVVDISEDGTSLEIHLDGDIVETLSRVLVTPLTPPTTGNHFLVGIDDTGGQENIHASHETWTFILSDNTTVTKEVILWNSPTSKRS